MSTAGDDPPPRTQPSSARTMVIIAFVLAGLGLLFLPIIFGPAAIILGIIAMRKGDPLGRWAIAAGVGALVLGLVFAAAVMGGNDDAAALLLVS